MMDFAILVTRCGENFVVLYEGDYEYVQSIHDNLSHETSDNKNTILVRVDENVYRDKRQYLEILNEYIESCIESK